MFKRKKIVSFILMVVMLLSMNLSAVASEAFHNDFQNVSTEPPTILDDIITFGLDKPSSSKVKDLKDGKMTFSGNATGSTLYTNNNFKGKTSIEYSITNDHDKTLTVKLYTSPGWFKTKKIEVAGKATLSGTMDGLEKGTLYYLTFSTPSDFSGYVQ